MLFLEYNLLLDRRVLLTRNYIKKTSVISGTCTCDYPTHQVLAIRASPNILMKKNLTPHLPPPPCQINPHSPTRSARRRQRVGTFLSHDGRLTCSGVGVGVPPRCRMLRHGVDAPPKPRQQLRRLQPQRHRRPVQVLRVCCSGRASPERHHHPGVAAALILSLPRLIVVFLFHIVKRQS